MRILLIRHGQPHIALSPRTGHAGFADYIDAYEEAGLAPSSLPPDELRAAFAPLLGERDASQVLLNCGSGVTACANLLAMEHAGLHGARIYAGSWSGWISDPSRPIETGPQK